MAGQRDQGTRGVLRRPRQRGGSRGIPVLRHPALAVRALAPQPEKPGHLGADVPPGQTLPAHDQDQAPLARSAVRRQVPMTGAQCGNPARWDLCGGPSARTVPTATNSECRSDVVYDIVMRLSWAAQLDWVASASATTPNASRAPDLPRADEDVQVGRDSGCSRLPTGMNAGRSPARALLEYSAPVRGTPASSEALRWLILVGDRSL